MTPSTCSFFKAITHLYLLSKLNPFLLYSLIFLVSVFLTETFFLKKKNPALKLFLFSQMADAAINFSSHIIREMDCISL